MGNTIYSVRLKIRTRGVSMNKELKSLLEGVSDSYGDFVSGSLASVKGNEERQKKLIQYIKDNPDAKTDDVIDYIFDDVVA